MTVVGVEGREGWWWWRWCRQPDWVLQVVHPDEGALCEAGVVLPRQGVEDAAFLLLTHRQPHPPLRGHAPTRAPTSTPGQADGSQGLVQGHGEVHPQPPGLPPPPTLVLTKIGPCLFLLLGFHLR